MEFLNWWGGFFCHFMSIGSLIICKRIEGNFKSPVRDNNSSQNSCTNFQCNMYRVKIIMYMSRFIAFTAEFMHFLMWSIGVVRRRDEHLQI